MQNITERQYYIDWLRILLIISVFLFHIGMIFNNWGWHVKNDVTFESKSLLWYIMVFLGAWRMPLLILISGAGTYFATRKRNASQYGKERFFRLFIPFILGIFTLVPIQVYIEKSDQYTSLLEFYPHMFEGIYPVGNFSWHHLWFIAYLFFISMLFIPILKLYKKGYFDWTIQKLVKLSGKSLGIHALLIPVLLTQIFLRPFFPDNSHDFIHDWAAISMYFLFFVFGFTMISRNDIMDNLRKFRWLNLGLAAISATLMLTIPDMIQADFWSGFTWFTFNTSLAWTCGLSALGFAKQHLNFNSEFRKQANEAIYPFYLLHQPIIVVIAYYIVPFDISVLSKAIIITLTSFTLTVIIYWALIRPYNMMRFVFGLKAKEKKEISYKIPKTVLIKADQ